MKMNRWLVMAGAAAMMCLDSSTLLAQNNGGGGPGGGRGNRGNFDPAQFQQRRMDNLREQLAITDDTEWNALQPLIQKVMDAQRVVMGDRMRGMRGPRGGGQGGDQAGDQGGRRFGPMGGQTSPEAEALQKAVDNKASKDDTKVALTKFLESRKAHEAALEKAQADLRKVLTVRQEAVMTLSGVL